MAIGAVVAKADREGLSIRYRIIYRIKHLGYQIYGPAQLDEHNDPVRRLEQERADKVAVARRARLDRERRAREKRGS
ncbi:hypothetical protein P0Y31_14720 [Knoellia sp. 3-2P3]|uniref:hypothetical protein n=1 Tax=unclassified Knoellia TaxID=2618719 RepID=UPI0023DCD2DA|nr:hypothetical protein [Knoellia sp. 3-2P3]MDF2093604.1 hypothetical protein [Knoellia sp. 3-2P3]